MCKTLEHIIHSHIINYLEDNQLLTDSQHGFRKNRSCETQLLETINRLAKSLNDRKQVDSVLLDFSKAFDKVCHRKLLLKMKHLGIKNSILDWISDFLSNRTQQVVVRGVKSENAMVESGVPQGSVLGPLLFLIYINDMPECVSSILALFADDAYIYKEINSQDDTICLQKDLDALVKWEKQWSMDFHPDKCKMLRITNKRKIIDGHYFIHGQQLENVKEAKYLGVTITQKLNWKSHVSKITAKANNCRIFLQRNLVKCSKDTKLLCYRTYVRPIIEYASSVWDPVNTTTLINKIEMVQRKSCRWIMNQWGQKFSPTQMIKKLSIKSLENRRKISKIKMLFDIENRLKFVSTDIIPRRQRCKNVKFIPMNGSILSYSNSFFPNSVGIWNNLPSDITNIDNRNLFIDKIENLFTK